MLRKNVKNAVKLAFITKFVAEILLQWTSDHHRHQGSTAPLSPFLLLLRKSLWHSREEGFPSSSRVFPNKMPQGPLFCFTKGSFPTKATTIIFFKLWEEAKNYLPHLFVIVSLSCLQSSVLLKEEEEEREGETSIKRTCNKLGFHQTTLVKKKKSQILK